MFLKMLSYDPPMEKDYATIFPFPTAKNHWPTKNLTNSSPPRISFLVVFVLIRLHNPLCWHPYSRSSPAWPTVDSPSIADESFSSWLPSKRLLVATNQAWNGDGFHLVTVYPRLAEATTLMSAMILECLQLYGPQAVKWFHNNALKAFYNLT